MGFAFILEFVISFQFGPGQELLFTHSCTYIRDQVIQFKIIQQTEICLLLLCFKDSLLMTDLDWLRTNGYLPVPVINT